MTVQKTDTRKTDTRKIDTGKIDTVVIGAGQAGLAMSEHLGNNGVDHIVLDLPPDEDAKKLIANPECVDKPIRELQLKSAGINSVIWATGYRNDFDWLQADVFDHEGKPVHQRGVTSQQGIYFLGLPWLSRRGSSFIWGVWHDAKYIADHITTQHRYMKYTPGV